MRRILLLLTILILLSSAACQRAAAPLVVGNRPVSINDVPANGVQLLPLKAVREMSWTSTEGNVQKINGLRRKVVIPDFWATYCPPCIKAIPHLMQIQAKYGAENVQVVGLHVGGQEDLAKVPEFAQRLKITYPLAVSEEALTQYIFGRETAVPQTAIFDRNGRLVKKVVGSNPEIQKELDAAVDEVVRSTD